VSKGHANYFNAKLKNKKYDFLIAPAASGEIAFLKTDIPIIYITDGTFAGCLNYHKNLSNLAAWAIKEGNSIEQRAIDNSKLVIVSSQWAAKSVINDYRASSEKVKVIPYGANFEILPDSISENEIPREWKLLFVGVYWESKGGDIAFNAFKILADKYPNIHLTVLGCTPPDNTTHPRLSVIPFIDKNNKEGQKKLFEIYKAHHFIILPTRFDCTPIVINEASAFGIPCLVADTGGVKGHLHEGVNGWLIDYNDTGKGYAEKIEALMNNPQQYIELRKTTRKEYLSTLNWQHWISELQKLL